MPFPWQIFFPKRCPFCGQVISWQSRCCDDCAPDLPFLPQKERKIADVLQPLTAYAPFSYEGRAEQAVWRLKFYGKPAVARHLAPYLAEVLPDGISFHLIVPIPMTRRKEKLRGYNQAALLARFLAEELHVPVSPVLKKCRETAQQHTLTARERRTNLQGAYLLSDPESVRGRRILLCDDVITTGSTLREAAGVLYSAGAASVHAVAIALAGNNGEHPPERSSPCPPQNVSITPSARKF